MNPAIDRCQRRPNRRPGPHHRLRRRRSNGAADGCDHRQQPDSAGKQHRPDRSGRRPNSIAKPHLDACGRRQRRQGIQSDNADYAQATQTDALPSSTLMCESRRRRVQQRPRTPRQSDQQYNASVDAANAVTYPPQTTARQPTPLIRAVPRRPTRRIKAPFRPTTSLASPIRPTPSSNPSTTPTPPTRPPIPASTTPISRRCRTPKTTPSKPLSRRISRISSSPTPTNRRRRRGHGDSNRNASQRSRPSRRRSEPGRLRPGGRRRARPPTPPGPTTRRPRLRRTSRKTRPYWQLPRRPAKQPTPPPISRPRRRLNAQISTIQANLRTAYANADNAYNQTVAADAASTQAAQDQAQQDYNNAARRPSRRRTTRPASPPPRVPTIRPAAAPNPNLHQRHPTRQRNRDRTPRPPPTPFMTPPPPTPRLRTTNPSSRPRMTLIPPKPQAVNNYNTAASNAQELPTTTRRRSWMKCVHPVPNGRPEHL